MLATSASGQSGCNVLKHLNPMNICCRKAKQQAVARVDSAGDKRMNQSECSLICQETSYLTNTPDCCHCRFAYSFDVFLHADMLIKDDPQISSMRNRMNVVVTNAYIKKQGSRRNFDVKWITSVLASLRDSLFLVAQILTSVMQAFSLSSDSSRSVFLNMIYICVSSAYSITFTPWALTMSSIGAVYIVR